MKIGEIGALVGLSSQTIRYYESKGLLRIPRRENAYRDYDENDAEILKRIKALRRLGVSISDIKLVLHAVLTPEELIRKRIAELEHESKTQRHQLELCREIAAGGTVDFDRILSLSGGEKNSPSDNLPETQTPPKPRNVYVGIDIGTTTVSVVVREGKLLHEVFTIPSNAAVGDLGLQSVDVILNKVTAVIRLIAAGYENICAIGLAGQMHGIVYTDRDGLAVSDLYTWQNNLGSLPFTKDGESYCQYLTRITGEKCFTGYGFVTDFVLRQKGQIPRDAHKICTVMDYAEMRLTGRREPLIHATNAASFGFYDLYQNRFREDQLEKIGFDLSLLPQIGGDGDILGSYQGIPVILAIGDNQAGFLGAAGDRENAVLINVGTGSQISTVCKKEEDDPSFEGEIRPFTEGKYLKCYSALCGGSAYSLMERFFRRFYTLCTGEDREIYDLLASMMKNCEPDDFPKVTTCFKGRRDNPSLRGSISGISMDNFTPEGLIYGVLDGIADELYNAYLSMNRTGGEKVFAASGNGIRKNPLLLDILRKKFAAPIQVSAYEEEAAVGASLFAEKALERRRFPSN